MLSRFTEGTESKASVCGDIHRLPSKGLRPARKVASVHEIAAKLPIQLSAVLTAHKADAGKIPLPTRVAGLREVNRDDPSI